MFLCLRAQLDPRRAWCSFASTVHRPPLTPQRPLWVQQPHLSTACVCGEMERMAHRHQPSAPETRQTTDPTPVEGRPGRMKVRAQTLHAFPSSRARATVSFRPQHPAWTAQATLSPRPRWDSRGLPIPATASCLPSAPWHLLPSEAARVKRKPAVVYNRVCVCVSANKRQACYSDKWGLSFGWECQSDDLFRVGVSER